MIGKKGEKVFSSGVSPSDAWTKAMDKIYRSEGIDPRMTKLSVSQHFGLTFPCVYKTINSMEYDLNKQRCRKTTLLTFDIFI